jgi:extracellular sulfatase Sulf
MTIFVRNNRKSTREIDNNSNNIPSLSKKQWLSLECQKPEYRYPCGPYQKFECFFDGYEMRIRKCRKSYLSKAINRKLNKHKCICPSDQTRDDYFNQEYDGDMRITSTELLVKPRKKKLDSIEKKLQRRFLKEHVINKDFRPVFIGSRSKRDLDIILNDGFDVDGVYQLNKLLDASTAKTLNDSGVFNPQNNKNIETTTCVMLSNLSVSCSDEIYQNKQIWREKKDRLDSMIKKLQVKLVELKGIRRHLNEKRPLFQGLNRDSYECNCNNKGSSRRDRFFKPRYINRKRMRMHERHQRKEKKLRRRTKFENTTCNYEKMNCFTHDNHHWKTAPFWTSE